MKSKQKNKQTPTSPPQEPAKATWQTRLKEFLWSVREDRKKQVGILIGGAVLLSSVIVILIIVVNQERRSRVINSELFTFSTDSDAGMGKARRFIDGVFVKTGEENLFPIAVMIENLITIRPQWGLQSASVVYEGLAEGGITRFLAVYATSDAIERIGPVRSARPYFVDWAEEYRGVYVHAGGSPEALSQLSDNDLLISLNQIRGDHEYFWRDSSILIQEHNLFTSSELLQFALRDKELSSRVGTFEPWKFQSPSKKKDRPTEEKKISIPFSSSSYAVEYRYDRDQNSYLRWNGGEEHIDQLTGEQLSVKNVVVLFVPTQLVDAQTGRLHMTTTGEGRAVVFREGAAIEGTWRKESEEDRTTFWTSEGEEIDFIPGNIWIEVLPEDRSIEY